MQHRLGEELHEVEERLPDVADRLDDPEPTRARQLSRDADHLQQRADELEGELRRSGSAYTSSRCPAPPVATS